MLKDIPRIAVEDIAVAVIPKLGAGEEEDSLWEVYILNLKGDPIENVIVSSKGYGSFKGEHVKTSTLRHYLGTIEALDYKLIEPIQHDVFGLNNEYWVSFYLNDTVFDKKYVFLPETIRDDFFTSIPLLNRKGVMIK